MNKIKLVLLLFMSVICLNVDAAADCSGMSSDVQQFAGQLSAQSKAIFCGEFTEAQRATAMQMVGQPDDTGVPMNPDQTVQKVASMKAAPSQQSKVPTGCPVK